MIKQSKIYMIITNKQGEKCIFLTPKDISKSKFVNPEIVYDGKEHAILYHNPKETIIIDYIPKQERQNLTKLSKILVVEYDVKHKVIAYEYMAKITIVENIPNISLNIEKK